MKIQVPTKFWNMLNPFAKVSFIIGTFFIHLAMKLAGMDEVKSYEKHNYARRPSRKRKTG